MWYRHKLLDSRFYDLLLQRFSTPYKDYTDVIQLLLFCTCIHFVYDSLKKTWNLNFSNCLYNLFVHYSVNQTKLTFVREIGTFIEDSCMNRWIVLWILWLYTTFLYTLWIHGVFYESYKLIRPFMNLMNWCIVLWTLWLYTSFYEFYEFIRPSKNYIISYALLLVEYIVWSALVLVIFVYECHQNYFFVVSLFFLPFFFTFQQFPSQNKYVCYIPIFRVINGGKNVCSDCLSFISTVWRLALLKIRMF